MKFDISKHILVPKHIKISQKEKEALFAQYNISIRELPKISKKDPSLRGLEAKPGDIIKIVRQSPTSGTHIFYRGVTDE